jgi:uncharacterized protein
MSPAKIATMHALMIAIVLPGAANPASAQSFDCRKAQTRIEKVICSEAAIADLDEHLGRYYAAGRAALEGAASCLQSDQAQWLTSTRDACQDAACLKTAYLNRLGELDPLQPGVTAIKTLELPRVPSLVWIIAPASDKVAAPPNPKATRFEATGRVLDEVAGGDGFMLQTKDGARLPLALVMFLEGKTPERLAALARETGATFRARGYAASDGTRTYFEPSRCTFIHRLPAAPVRPPNDPDH